MFFASQEVCGVGYLIIGLFGASVVSLFAFLPKALITTLAGIALLGTLVSSLTSSLQYEKNRESSIITFAITVSGMSFFGLGSALWGLVAKNPS
ncbi:benzoate/H(+) symporter BenE family transporter [Enterovibrio calviensis]|uniref:benzoate/H(+) symporter BenE family transporter n=1 Tax=Enterovibrio calviensis TaxID=91359 RepID=UPI0037360D87